MRELSEDIFEVSPLELYDDEYLKIEDAFPKVKPEPVNSLGLTEDEADTVFAVIILGLLFTIVELTLITYMVFYFKT